MVAPRSVGVASEVMSGRERMRLSPACSRRCMYSAACLPDIACMCEVALAARTFMDLGGGTVCELACGGVMRAWSSYSPPSRVELSTGMINRLWTPNWHSAPPCVQSCPTDKRVSWKEGAQRTSRRIMGRATPCSSVASR
eukprot:1695037-Pleurochrysis_carterae.AAC.1